MGRGAHPGGRRGLIDARPIGRVIREWCARQNQDPQDGSDRMSPMTALAFRSGLSWDLISKVARGHKRWIGFDNADKIVCNTIYHWRYDHELNEIYQNVDLVALDRLHPTCEAADEFRQLVEAGWSNARIAAMFDVHWSTIGNRKMQREAKGWAI